MKVVMIGTGYVGLVTGACFAELGAEVVCLDRDVAKIEGIKDGRMPIYEPGLDALVDRNVVAERLKFTTSYSVVSDADLVFIAVGTPERKGDGHADMSQVFGVAAEIAKHLTGFTVIVDKSTVPVGTAEKVGWIVRSIAPDAQFSVASNPEFLREGSAIDDFLKPDRIVVGVSDHRAASMLERLYRPLVRTGVPLRIVDPKSAELIKYASNAFLATKISFVNEIAHLCEKVGADIRKVADGMGLDSRIGAKFLQPGPGYGGSCFPKDTMALCRTAQESEAPCRIVEAAIAANEVAKVRAATKVLQAMEGRLLSSKIAVLGLTFKPETDDMRDSPALAILPKLVELGFDVWGHDPEGMEEARSMIPPQVTLGKTIGATIENAEAVVLLTDWNEYVSMDLGFVAEEMSGRLFIDLRNAFEPAAMARSGLDYRCIGG